MCIRDRDMVDLGILPSGGRLRINKAAVEADLLVAEGFIEPHFFAGFSGGQNSQIHHVLFRRTIVNQNMLFFGHLRPQLVHKLLPGGAPMASGGDEQGDLGLRCV